MNESNDSFNNPNRVKSFEELTKEIKASWSDEAWMVYEAASQSFVAETESKNDE